jgi:hypothetical protein
MYGDLFSTLYLIKEQRKPSVKILANYAKTMLDDSTNSEYLLGEKDLHGCDGNLIVAIDNRINEMAATLNRVTKN